VAQENAPRRPAVTGTLIYLQRIALPPDAVAEVSLLKGGSMETRGETLAVQTTRPAGQVPIPFYLPYDPNRIDPKATYLVGARVKDRAGRTLFLTAKTFPVLTGGKPSTDVTVTLSQPGALPPAPAANGRISGRLTYRQRNALTPGATARVRLLDVSRADAPAREVSRASVAQFRQVPIPFVLYYPTAGVLPRGRFVLEAQIRDAAGRVLFSNRGVSTAVALTGRPVDNLEIVLRPEPRR
jgi:uncharacterized lipoprotein YbaY